MTRDLILEQAIAERDEARSRMVTALRNHVKYARAYDQALRLIDTLVEMLESDMEQSATEEQA